MNYEEKKKSLVEEFNKNQELLAQLNQRQQQIIGQFNLLEELKADELKMGNENRQSEN